MDLQIDKLHPKHREWVEENGLYLFSTHNEEWAWNKEKLRALNDQGGRPVATVVARNSGLHSKDASAETAGGLQRQTYLCKGARCMLTSGIWQEWGLYNGAIGEVLEILYHDGEAPPRHLPACVLVRFRKYRGPVFLQGDPKVVPIAPIERLLERRRRCSRVMIPLIPAWGLTFHKSQGMTCGAGYDAECVVVHPAKPSFEKSHPGGLYTAFSRAKSAGSGVYGSPGFEPSAIYVQALCSRERILLRVDNEITAGRDRATKRLAKIAEDTKARNPGLASRFDELVQWAATPLAPDLVESLFSRD